MEIKKIWLETKESTTNPQRPDSFVQFIGQEPIPTSDGSGETILKVVNDSTLRLVNSDFEEAASKLNYDLKLKK